MEEMFRRVGARYSEKVCREDGWYRKRSWTMAQEEEFRKWMTDLIRRRHRWPKKTAQKEASWFLLMYSWHWPPEGCLAVDRGRRFR
jgi:hypothetical protein